jgi:archaellum biogenesis protein FlaJ (TadC family)
LWYIQHFSILFVVLTFMLLSFLYHCGKTGGPLLAALLCIVAKLVLYIQLVDVCRSKGVIPDDPWVFDYPQKMSDHPRTVQ